MKVAVIGLGAIGSQVLLHLSQMENVQVTGFEKFGGGHGFGASGGENRLFSRTGLDYANYTELMDYALEVWARLQADSGRVIVKRAGYLSVTDEAVTESNRMMRAAQTVAPHAEILTTAQLADRFPFQSYLPGDAGVFDPTGGMIRTDAAILEAIQAARKFGAVIHEHTHIDRVEESSRGVEIEANDTVHTFDRIVITTGPWVHQLLPELESHVNVYRPTSAWFLPREPSTTIKGVPALARDGVQQFYAAPTFDGASLKVGYGGPRQLEIHGGPQAADSIIDPSSFGEFPEILGTYLTGFHAMPHRMAQFFEGYTTSTFPVIQHTSERIVAGVGFSGYGFKLSPVYGKLLAETVSGASLSPLLQPMSEQISQALPSL